MRGIMSLIQFWYFAYMFTDRRQKLAADPQLALEQKKKHRAIFLVSIPPMLITPVLITPVLIYPSVDYPSVDQSRADYPSIAYANIDYCSVDDAWPLGVLMALKGMVMLMPQEVGRGGDNRKRGW